VVILRPLSVFAALLAALLVTGCALLRDPLEARLLYRPWPADPARLASYSKSIPDVEDVSLIAADGATLRGWLQKPTGARKYPLVIVFGSAVREVSSLLQQQKASDWGWLLVNYRGFGASEGSPSEDLVISDAKLIYDYAASRADVDAGRIVALGRSIGSAVAVSAALERTFAGLILGTPFASLAEVADRRYPGISLLVGGRYDSAARAPRITRPALFLIATNDQVASPESGERLARAWGGEVRVVRIMGASHYSAERNPQYWTEIGAFLAQLAREARQGP
jgi:pimeloyl-ACP methyl ester carboxylesterase